ncbi:hypothetical protein BCY86_00245 [Pajaroellobacter abortibovis]|uniref:Uncharacterized protein n=1 Tax=Pajaroellobacter abortibovis TaxID=1882918 RepID=A0A1L6MUW1_9BACT|nr:hypothetical protein BCY86_00245 [Pajaroellobacter abortibovis]
MFFPIDFNVSEMEAYKRGTSLITKAFFLHDMAPMACRIAGDQENRLVFLDGSLERFGSLGIPNLED